MPEETSIDLGGKNIHELIGTIIDIPIERISPDKKNLREVFDADDIRDLGLNMKKIGQLDDITVFPKIDMEGKWNGEFDLHDGERRWRAAKSVGITALRAKVVERPTDQELLLKRTSRVLQTRSLEPEEKMEAVRKALDELGVLEKPESWESHREQLGGGAEWPQIVRVLKAQPLIKQMLNQGTINFTLAQSIARLPQERQEEAAKYAVVNKLGGRFFSTQMVPYLIENPDASMAQAFENARVGGWRQNTKSPYKRGEEPPVEKQLEEFLDSCVLWERAWEVLVHTGLIFKISGDINYETRIKEALLRITERVQATIQKVESKEQEATKSVDLLAGRWPLDTKSFVNKQESEN